MRIHWHLLTWMFRPLQGLTLVCSASAAFYVLSFHSVLNFRGDSMAILFVVAHLPGDISVMGMLVTAAAALAFTAAYQVSERLWLPMGMHFAWNYLFSAVFSVQVSGHKAEGWLHGSMSGPDWLSGGSYGVEASAMALIVWSAAAALLLRRAHTQGRFKPCLQRAS